MAVFYGSELRIWLAERLKKALAAVEDIDPALVRAAPADVTAEIVSQHDVEPLQIYWERMERSEAVETTAERAHAFRGTARIRALRYPLHVPFRGEAELFKYRASIYSDAKLDGDIHPGWITFGVTAAANEAAPDYVLREIATLRQIIDQMVNWSNNDARAWSGSLRQRVEKAIGHRRDALERSASISAALDIPIRVADPSERIDLSVERKRIQITATTDSANVAARISDEIYEDVLDTIMSTGRALERSPRTASKFNEEELRDILLFVLNSNYKGLARGEVFNGAGKTDILITHNDQNAFIGECKFWSGPKNFDRAIDQYLRYTVWRDTKGALVLFITRRDASAAIEAADKAIRSHSCFVSATTSPRPDLRRDYMMRHIDDQNREIRTALLPVVVRQPPDE